MSTSASDDEWAARSRSFGAAAEHYDRSRPSYNPDLVDDVVAMLPGRDVLEVGAGTGKATVLFAARDLHLQCIEPDADMAALLHRNCGSLTNVEVTVTAFEDFAASHTYDGLIAAQSWHWTNRETRYSKAAELLTPGGLLATFWNRVRADLVPLAPTMADIYRRHDMRPPDELTAEDPTFRWPSDDAALLAAFTDFDVRGYDSTQHYSAQEWCDYEASTSIHLIADPQRSSAVLADIAAVIESAGGFDVHRRCDLLLARRATGG